MNIDYLDKKINTEDPEEVLLTILLGSKKYSAEIFNMISEQHFERPVFREIFKICKSEYLKDEKIIELQAFKNYKEYSEVIYNLTFNYISGATYKYWCLLLQKLYEERTITETKLRLENVKTIEEYQSIINDTNNKIKKQETRVIEINDNVLSDFINDYYNGFESVKSYFPSVDKITGGFYPGESIIIGARPSMGKTAFGLNIARMAAKEGKNVAIWSGEMKANLLINRLVCAEGGIDSSKVRSRELTSNQLDEFAHVFNNKIKPLPLIIIDKPSIKLSELKLKLIQCKKNKGLDLVIIDYLALMKSDNNHKDPYQEVSEISRELKIMAGELDVPVITFCQLSRNVETRQNKRPFLSDLRESGHIEQDADIVMFLYRDEYYNPDTVKKNIIEVLIPKQRNGETGMCELYFDKTFQRIRN